ncbi:YchJ family protein [Limibacter armeniacum]|uniref:YchJ family protein n=1 Tax=Limibacter armeniacum TaxID=466084 RepID=UPI002FE5CAA8
MEKCPCGSGKSYDTCCGPYISGTEKPKTAEQLMRSRYTAHVKNEIDYIINTVHPSERKSHDKATIAEWAKNTEWQGLELISRELGSINHEIGKVEFKAHYKEGNALKSHHENSTFRKVDGVWYFHSGKLDPKEEVNPHKVGRNDPCPCGSGKKYKKCCG